MEEDLNEATNGNEWAESDAAEEKKAIARIIQYSRSWGRRARCKIEEFRANEIRHYKHGTINRTRNRFRANTFESASPGSSADRTGVTRFGPER